MSRKRILIAVASLLVVSACTARNSTEVTTSDPGTMSLVPTESATTSTGRVPISSVAAPEHPTMTAGSPHFRSEPGIVCDDVGCTSVLTIELDEADVEPNHTYNLEICVDGDCTVAEIAVDIVNPATHQVSHGSSERQLNTLERQIVMWPDDDRIEYVLPDKDYGKQVSVTFTLEDANGLTLATTDGAASVPVERSQPSGAGCPICFFVRLPV